MEIKLFYSPQPDEQPDSSAAFEYANRASELLSKESDMNVDVQQLSIESLNIESNENSTNEDDDDDDEPSVSPSDASPKCTFVIISCSADGSVNRIVRKILRNLKNVKSSKKNGESSKAHEYIAIALLGHARCDNSGKQMKDTIFNHGRKFHQCIEAATRTSVNTNVVEKIEVQVELEGPDQPGGFDEWAKANAIACIQES